jgi:hypothetical protein
MVDFDTVFPVPTLLPEVFTYDHIVLIAAAQNPVRRFRVAWQVVLPHIFNILTTVERRPEKTCHVAAAQEPQSYTDLLYAEAHARPYMPPFVEQATEPVAVAGSGFRPFFGAGHAEDIVKYPKRFWNGSILL